MANRQLHFGEKDDHAVDITRGEQLEGPESEPFALSSPSHNSGYETTSFQHVAAAAERTSIETEDFEFEGAFSQYVDYEGCESETVHLVGGEEQTFAYDYE